MGFNQPPSSFTKQEKGVSGSFRRERDKMKSDAILLIGVEIHKLVLVNVDHHRGRIMAEYAEKPGIERFTKRKDGGYCLLGKKEGRLFFTDRDKA